MGVILRLAVFLVGALGLVFVGLDAASGFMDTSKVFEKLGPTPGGIATTISTHFGAGLDMLGGMIAKAQGADVNPDKPGVLVSYGPDVIAAVASGLMMMFGMRR